MESYTTGNFAIRLRDTELGVEAIIEENGYVIATLLEPDENTAKRYANEYLNNYLARY